MLAGIEEESYRRKLRLQGNNNTHRKTAVVKLPQHKVVVTLKETHTKNSDNTEKH